MPIARERKSEWLKDKCCCKCGSTENLCIEYHNPRLSFQLWMWAKHGRRKRALAKAKVWCEQHLKDHRREKKYGWIEAEHGTPQRYRRGCHCAECKKAISKYQCDLVKKHVVKP